MSDKAETQRRGDEPVWPLVVWWWDQAEDRDVPSTHAICWVELVACDERRAGTVQVSKRTADPRNPDDPAVRVELHHHLERRLGTTIRVDHALRHLDQLRIGRRLAVRGHRVSTLSLEGYQHDLLGGVAAHFTGEAQLSGEVVIRAGLGANARDELLVWAERTFGEAAAGGDSRELAALGWTLTRRGGWQQLLYSTQDSPIASVNQPDVSE